MTRAGLFRALAVPLALILASCMSAGTGRTPAPVPCNALIIDGANYADAVAVHREEQMKLMRFASEQAMNAYIAETQRLRTEAIRITMRLDDILAKHGGIADYNLNRFDDLSSEDAAARIAAADACADEALK